MTPLRRTAFVLALGLAACVQGAAGQVIPVYGVLYRPPGLSYEVLRTRHFDIIHESGGRERATELAAVLEDALPEASVLFPIRSDFRMPVVLNRFNDRGNGYVSPIAFRQEIEEAPLASRIVSPRHASWFEVVGPHELVHAVHADYGGGFGVGSVVRFFAPDMARALNLWVPPGVAEGIAEHLESSRGLHAGRLNYTYFTMQYRAAAASGRPWSLAQALEVSTYSRPTDRHYIGGGQFVDWFLDRYGLETFQRVTRTHNRFPLFGYGISLWLATGESPWALGRAFRRDATRAEAARRDSLAAWSGAASLASARGTLHRRPRWLDDSTLVVHVTGYGTTRGLYAVHTGSGRRRPIAYEELTTDLHVAVSRIGRELVYARYVADPYSPLRQVADLFLLDWRFGNVERITHGARLLFPVADPVDGGYLAVETAGRGGAIVRVSASGDVAPWFSDPDLRITGMASDPLTGRTAVVANRYGQQDLYELVRGEGGPRLEHVVGFRDGSVLDAAWSGVGDWLVLTADRNGSLDVYAHDTGSGATVRLTQARFGAMEPDVSPDGTRIAYVRYEHARFDLVVEAFDPGSAAPVPSDRLVDDPKAVLNAPVDVDASVWTDTVAVPYRAGRYLRPRMLYPTLYYEDQPGSGLDADLGVGYGVAVQGADPLLQWSYWGEAVVQKGRLWGEAAVVTGTSILRPAARVYSRPETITASFVSRDGTRSARRVIREQRGVQLGIGLPVTLSNNVHSSSLAIGMGLQAEQERLFERGMEPLGPYVGRLTAAGSVGLGVRLQRNLRDLIPNTGLATGVAWEVDLASETTLRRALIGSITAYLPWLSRWNIGLRVDAGLVTQSESAVYDLDLFMPRGQEDHDPAVSTLLRFGSETVVPLVYVDDGLFVLPIYLSAVYLYGFGETVLDVQPVTSVGGGLGLQFRLFYVLDFDLRLGVARRLDRGDWHVIYR